MVDHMRFFVVCAGAVTDGAVVDRGGAAVFLAVRGGVRVGL